MSDLIFATDSKEPRQCLIEMLHALDVLLQEMGQETGCIRVLICTIAFGMVVNCKGVQSMTRLGPPKSVEAYTFKKVKGQVGMEAPVKLFCCTSH